MMVVMVIDPGRVAGHNNEPINLIRLHKRNVEYAVELVQSRWSISDDQHTKIRIATTQWTLPESTPCTTGRDSLENKFSLSFTRTQ